MLFFIYEKRRKIMKRAVLLTFTLLLTFAFSGCSYNDLTAKQQRVKGAWANVESAMQRRADMLPNLFEAAKAASFNEQTVFGKIADARTKLANAQKAEPAGEDGIKTPEQKKAIWQANSELSRLLVLFENYPQLRSNEGFLKVQDEVAGSENRINIARKDYNAAVTDYNTTRNQFPGVLTASLVGFPEEPYFQADERGKEVPKLDASEVKGDN
jgi:LemA protein